MASLVINLFAKSYTSVRLVSVSVSIQANAIICLKSLNHRPCAIHLVVTIQTFTPTTLQGHQLLMRPSSEVESNKYSTVEMF